MTSVPHRPAPRALAVWALALATLAALPAPVGAHALVRSTEPAAESVVDAAPRQVVLRFSEPVEAAFGAVRVFRADGERVDDGRARHVPGDPRTVVVALVPRLPDGTYTVSWRVVSADGHPISEAFLFHVGAPGADAPVALADVLAREKASGPLADVWLGVSRWLLFAGLVLLIGGLAFLPLIWDRGDALPEALAAARGRMLRAGWTVAVAATAMGAVGQIAVAAGLPLHRALSPALLVELLRTRYGMAAMARLLLLALLAPLAWRARPRLRAWAWPALFVLAATPGLSGHAGTTEPAALHAVVDALHVMAAAVWLGGLLLVRYALRPEGTAGTRSQVAARFSSVALRAVGVLVVTGVVRAWAEVGALQALWSTPYGLVFLAKLAAFLPMIGLAAWNRARVLPRLATDEAAHGALRRHVAVEAALGVVVLALTALLVNSTPARVAAGLAGPAITEAALGDGRLDVIVDPNVVGENVVHLTMSGTDGRPLDVETVRVRFRMPDQDIGPIEGEAIRLGAGHFAVQGRQLSVPGLWTIEVLVPVDRFTDLRATVSVRVNP